MSPIRRGSPSATCGLLSATPPQITNNKPTPEKTPHKQAQNHLRFASAQFVVAQVELMPTSGGDAFLAGSFFV